MDKSEAQSIMAEMVAESRAKPRVVGQMLGCSRTLSDVRLYVTTEAQGERWHVNGKFVSKAKALQAVVS